LSGHGALWVDPVFINSWFPAHTGKTRRYWIPARPTPE